MSNFLEKLKKSLDTGISDSSVASEFNETVKKAAEVDSLPGKVDELRQKAVEAQESRKPLTKEEIKELQFVAMKQQQKIDEFEFQTTLGAVLVNIDLTIEKLENKILELKASSTQLRDESIPVKEKKIIVKNVLKDINATESPIVLEKQASVTDHGILFRED